MKTTKIITLSIILLLITACGTKVPFKAQEPVNKASLVYIYVSSEMRTDDGNSEGDFAISINNKRVLQRVKEGEYTLLNLKPEKMNISVTKSQILEQVINMDLKEGETYYLRVKEGSNDKFDFTQVSSSLALKELSKTGLAGSSVQSVEYMVTELVTGTQEEKSIIKVPASTKAPITSKVDEIQKAYKLKEQGVLSEEEFQALKTEILTK
ncbi:MAG: hypothetical protein ACJAWW_001258 [Sulfurimonas sp.]|jgi:hypothetical protein